MKLYIFLMVFMLLITSVKAIICQDETYTADIPCIVITPVLSCNDNVSITNINTLENFNQTIYSVGDGTYNFTFNYSVGSYAMRLCDNSTGSIVVKQTIEIDTTGGSGYSAPDPSAIKKGIYDEVKVYVDKFGKTAQITFWIALIALIFGILAYMDFKKRNLKILAGQVKKEINRSFR